MQNNALNLWADESFDKREAEAAKRRKELGLDVVSEDDEDEVDHLKALDLGQAGPSPLKKLCQAIIEHRYFASR